MSFIGTICQRHSGSAALAASMIDFIFESFETALLLKTVETKLKPYSARFACKAAFTLGIYDIQGYDPKADD